MKANIGRVGDNYDLRKQYEILKYLAKCYLKITERIIEQDTEKRKLGTTVCISIGTATVESRMEGPQNLKIQLTLTHHSYF